MTCTPLGNSDLSISSIGLGTWAIGGEWSFGWGPQEDAQSIEALRKGIEMGINWIDTAPGYGYGHAEEIVAETLKDFSPADRPWVFTKVSLVWDDEGNVSHCLKADSVQREVEDSLRRLKIETLDLCQIHWPVFPPDQPDTDLEEGWTMLAKLKQEGKIRHIGVSNFNVDQLKRAQSIAPVTSLQPPYSMLMRQIEAEILPYCEQEGIGVIVYSPMHNGLLSGAMTRERVEALPETDWRRNSNLAFQEPHLTKNLEIAALLREIGSAHGRTAGEVAVCWTLHHTAVTGAIVGVRKPQHVNGLVGALEFRLSDDEVAAIQAELPESIDLFNL